MLPPARPRAFTLVPVVALLAVTLIGLGIALGVKNSKNPPPLKPGVAPNSAYAKGNKAGGTYGPAIAATGLGLVMLGAASRIADTKGQGPATMIIGGILLLAHLPYVVNLLRSGPPGPASARGPGAPVVAPPAPPSHAATPRPRPSPPAANAHQAEPSPRPAPSRAELARREQDARDDAASKPLMEAKEKEIAASIEKTLTAVAPFIKEIARPPAHSAQAVEKRGEEADAARASLSDLASAMESASKDLLEELKAAGLTEVEAHHRSVKWEIDFGPSRRAMSVGWLVRLAEKAKQEADALEEHFDAWKLEHGEITATVARLRGEVTSPRFFIEADLKSVPQWMDEIRGK